MTDLPYGTTSSENDDFFRTWQNGHGPGAWLRAVNNGPIGKRFLVTGFAFFLVGGIQALLMRIQLARPDADLISPELYNQLMTMHGSTMLFLFVVPILEGFATLIAPSMLGSRDLPFPRLTAFAYWCYLFGGILMYSSFLLGTAPDGGWFAYVPLTGPEYSPGVNMDFWLLGLELAEASGIISAFELIVAVMTMRAPGMTLGRLPIFLWAMLVVSAMILFAFMTVLLASLFLELDRKIGTAFFDVARGGSPLLWQHLFWFFGHPEVYIQFLPAAGMVSMIVPVFARRPLVSYGAVVFALVSTGVLSFGLWAHHMFTVGLPEITTSFFSAASIVIAIPTGLQFFVWIATIWAGDVRWKTPMLYVAGFLVTFLIGGLTGVMVGVAPFDWQLHDSYFVVAHFHYVLIGGVVFPLLAAISFWAPKFTGRMMSERLGAWSFWLAFLGFHATFFPMHLSGLLAMPRRVYTFPGGVGLDLYNLISTLGAFVFASGVLIFVFAFVRSARGSGSEAGPNPWGAYSLEWSTTSPPPPYSFRKLPIVTSRYPLWQQERLDEGDEATVAAVEALESWPTTWQGAIVTDTFTGRLREVFWLPNTSYMPVTAAFGLALALGALIFDWYLPAAIGLGLAVVAYLVWMWPTRNDTSHAPEVEATFRRLGVGVYLHSSPTISRWTNFLTMAIALATLATLLFSYGFLAVNSAGAWVPPGGEIPGFATSVLALLLLVAGVVLIHLTRPGEGARRRGRSAAGLAVAALLGFVAGALQITVWTDFGFGWTDHAYGSIVWLLVAFQAFMLVTSLVMTTMALFRVGFRPEDEFVERVRVSVANAVLTGGTAALCWLLIGGVLYLVGG